LDENALAGWPLFVDASYFKLNFVKHSLESKLAAFAIDSTGNERNSVYFMRMDETKTLLEDKLEGVYEHFEFSQDALYCYYTLLDECERAFQLKRHAIGTHVDEDEILYHEPDDMFFLSLTKSCNGNYIILNSAAQITSETRFLPANDNKSQLTLLFPRREHVQYTSESHGEHFYTLTNEDSKNNWLFRTLVPKTEPVDWEAYINSRETVIEHRDFVLIEDFGLRRNHLIVFERSNCLQNVRIVDLSVPGFSSYHYISFSEQVYSLWPGSVREEVADLTKSAQFDTDELRFFIFTKINGKGSLIRHLSNLSK
jgi:oligopeptidase B